MIGQERILDRIDLHFIFNDHPFVFMRVGDVHRITSFVEL